jgi:hypothetical protein
MKSIDVKNLTHFIPLIAVAGMVLFGSGCQSGPTHKQGFDFSRYHTFAILPVTARGTYQDPALVTRLKGPVTETVVETLTGKGFKQVAESEADFHVNLLFDYREEPGQTEQRMFDLQIIDAKTKEVVWSDYWHRTTDATLPPEVVHQGVADMLKPFPPGAK